MRTYIVHRFTDSDYAGGAVWGDVEVEGYADVTPSGALVIYDQPSSVPHRLATHAWSPTGWTSISVHSKKK